MQGKNKGRIIQFDKEWLQKLREIFADEIKEGIVDKNFGISLNSLEGIGDIDDNDEQFEKYISILKNSINQKQIKTVGSILSNEESIGSSNNDDYLDDNNATKTMDRKLKLNSNYSTNQMQLQKLDMYKKVQQAFMDEEIKKDEQKKEKQEGKLDLKSRWRIELLHGLNSDEEKEYIEDYKEIVQQNVQVPILEIIEMNDFERINTYPQFTFKEKCIKKLLYSQRQLNQTKLKYLN